MVARLRFAIATDVQPHILILDEVLAVVDARFKQKKSGVSSSFGTAGNCFTGTSRSIIHERSLHGSNLVIEGQGKVCRNSIINSRFLY